MTPRYLRSLLASMLTGDVAASRLWLALLLDEWRDRAARKQRARRRAEARVDEYDYTGPGAEA